MKKLITLLFVTFILVGCSNASTKTITLDEAQEIALAEVDGKVTRAVEETDDGRSYYEFDIIANDQKHELEVDEMCIRDSGSRIRFCPSYDRNKAGHPAVPGEFFAMPSVCPHPPVSRLCSVRFWQKTGVPVCRS